MDAIPGSTIAALCFKHDPEVDVHRLATDLSRFVSETEAVRFETPAEGFVLCEASDMRIALAQVALDRAFPGSLTGRHYPTCMVLSVGPDGKGRAGQTNARHARVHADLLSRLQDVAAADRIVMFERAGPYHLDLHDVVVDDIRAHLDKLLGSRRAPVADIIQAAPIARQVQQGHIPAPPPRAIDVTQPDDMIQGLASRLEAELDRLLETRRALEMAGAAPVPVPANRRHAPRPWRPVVARLISGPPASTRRLFGGPKDIAGMDGAYPDYEHMPANVDERPLLHRAAVNALNVTVMTVALPVGAALLTMSVLGREDMLFSSRVTAVTGLGVGLYNTGVAEKLFTLFS